MENERVMQAHLPGAHHEILRRVNLSLCGHALIGQVVGIGAIGVRNETKTMRPGHNAQTTVFYSRGCQPKPDRGNVSVFQSFRDAILVPPDERSAPAMLVKQPGRFEQDVGAEELF